MNKKKLKRQLAMDETFRKEYYETHEHELLNLFVVDVLKNHSEEDFQLWFNAIAGFEDRMFHQIPQLIEFKNFYFDVSFFPTLLRVLIELSAKAPGTFGLFFRSFFLSWIVFQETTYSSLSLNYHTPWVHQRFEIQEFLEGHTISEQVFNHNHEVRLFLYQHLSFFSKELLEKVENHSFLYSLTAYHVTNESLERPLEDFYVLYFLSFFSSTLVESPLSFDGFGFCFFAHLSEHYFDHDLLLKVTPLFCSILSTVENDPKPSSMILTWILQWIANWTYHRKIVVDFFVTAGLFPLILSQCQIKDDQPWLREWSVFAIRNITEESSEAQDFLLKLRKIN